MKKPKHWRMLILLVSLSTLVFAACAKEEAVNGTANSTNGTGESVDRIEGSTEGSGQSLDTGDMYIEFTNHIVEAVLEYSDVNSSISASDVVIDQIYFGSFSKENADEIFVLCKILNMPHAGGLDRTMGLVMEADSLDVITYREFLADDVVINCVQTASGQSRIVYTGASTYQGLTGQSVYLFAVNGSEWEERPIEALEAFGEEIYCFVGENQIIVASEYKLTNPGDVIAVLNWNPETEQFEGTFFLSDLLIDGHALLEKCPYWNMGWETLKAESPAITNVYYDSFPGTPDMQLTYAESEGITYITEDNFIAGIILTDSTYGLHAGIRVGDKLTEELKNQYHLIDRNENSPYGYTTTALTGKDRLSSQKLDYDTVYSGTYFISQEENDIFMSAFLENNVGKEESVFVSNAVGIAVSFYIKGNVIVGICMEYIV